MLNTYVVFFCFRIILIGTWGLVFIMNLSGFHDLRENI